MEKLNAAPYEKDPTVEDVTTALPGPITCLRRTTTPGPWIQESNLDRWLQFPNGDRVCSFCGSLHPDDFKALIKDAQSEKSDTRIDLSDKAYKVYVTRDSVANALEGGIKFYGWHLEDPPTAKDDTDFTIAIEASQDKFVKMQAVAVADMEVVVVPPLSIKQ